MNILELSEQDYPARCTRPDKPETIRIPKFRSILV